MSSDLPAKRLLDVAVASVALVLTLPIQVVTAVAVRLRLGRPVLFRQVRPGLHAEPFVLLKFRTMLEPDPSRGLVDDAERLTPLGRWLRSTSIDELPTLWNVVRGDMSLVGPRPLLPEYLPLYTAEQARRHDVRPGLTGLAQVSGRNRTTWERRLELDVRYVDTRSMLGDLRILVRTVRSVVGRHGISAEEHPTMSRFTGTRVDHGEDAT